MDLMDFVNDIPLKNEIIIGADINAAIGIYVEYMSVKVKTTIIIQQMILLDNTEIQDTMNWVQSSEKSYGN